MDEFAKTAYWLDCADYDLHTAKAMLETKRFLYVGFMCHQTIEKGLKAVFVQRQPNSELPYIHSLVRLANLPGIAAAMNESQLSLLYVLNPLNIETRYPLNKEKLLRSLTESRCEDLIRKAEELLTWIKTKC